jgi:hypothetical protein
MRFIYSIFCFLTFISITLSSDFLFPKKWNGLKVTWGINLFKSFNSLPRTEQDAISKNWKLESDCSKVNGKRYVLNEDTAVMLIFDQEGIIAGISSAVPKNLPFNFPSAKVQEYMMDEGAFYTITAYFTDPNTVCSSNKASQVTGDRLLIVGQTKQLNIALNQSDVSDFWTKGKCFKTMGVHYWSDLSGALSDDTEMDDFFPMFLLYNRGKLNGFGWAFNADLKSDRYEHPPPFSFPLFFNKVPKSLIDSTKAGVISTLHIYLDNMPLFNGC